MTFQERQTKTKHITKYKTLKSWPHKWTLNPKISTIFGVERPFMRSGLWLRYFCKKWFYTVGKVQNEAKNMKKHKKLKNTFFCYFFEKINKDREFTFVKNSILLGFESAQQCRFTLLTISDYRSCLIGARLGPQKRIPENTEIWGKFDQILPPPPPTLPFD